MSKKITRTEVIEMIRALVTSNRTATLYIHTDKNHMVMVATQGGEVITLSSGPRHGVKAIPYLREMLSAVVRVDANAIAYHTENVPPTRVILSMLEAEAVQASGAVAKGPAAAASPGMEMEKVKTILSQLLAEYLGPIAPMACEHVLNPMGDTLDIARLRDAVEQLAEEAGGPAESRTFTQRAWHQLKL